MLTNATQKGGPLIKSNTLKKLRERTEPGLVAFYDIRPENGAGLFLQPQSPHKVPMCEEEHQLHAIPRTTTNSYGCQQD